MKPAGTLPNSLARLGGALALAFAAVALLAPAPAQAKEKNNAVKALETFNGKKAQVDPIRNRFFLKSNRFEIAPAIGYVPNNAFADVYVGGAFLAYHFSERLAVEAAVMYSPNTQGSGVKGLTTTLLDIAYQSDPKTTFQQPIDRLGLAAAFSARWAPVYGKINLLGEGVVNFDLYGTGGLGLLDVTKDVATVSQDYKNGSSTNPVAYTQGTATFNPALNLGAGLDFYVSPSVAIRLDARTLVFVGQEADYIEGDIDPSTGQTQVLHSEIQSVFITTGGVSIFVPKMKPRLFNF